MYSLIIAGSADAWDNVDVDFDIGRFLEYTDDALQEKFRDSDAGHWRLRFARTIEAFPTLIGYEKARGKDFRLAQISNLRQDGSTLKFHINFQDTHVSWDFIEQNQSFFQLGRWQENRTHWSIRTGDLQSLFTSHGLSCSPVSVTQEPVPRVLLLDAARVLTTLSHADLDTFLLELDVAELDAPRSLGSRQERTNALAKFAAAQPDVLTISGDRLDRAVVKRAMKADNRYPDTPIADVQQDVRDRFWQAINDGASFAIKGSVLDRPGGLFPKPGTMIDGAAPKYGSVSQSEAIEKQIKPQPPNWHGATSRPALEASANVLEHAKPRIFIVHGRDQPLKIDVENYLRKIGCDPIILHEQDNAGRHLLTKFVEVADTCQAAVVLVAAEDLGRHTSEADLENRARQNVVLELGYFLGKLGPQRTMMITRGQPAMPTDMAGIVHIRYEDRWKADLARELAGAGIAIDAMAALRA